MCPAPRGSSPYRPGAGSSCQPQGSCSPHRAPASAKAQIPPALRDERDVSLCQRVMSPCGLAPPGCRLQGPALLLGSQLSPAGPGAPGALGSPVSPNLPLDGEAARAQCPGHSHWVGSQPLAVPSRAARRNKTRSLSRGPGLRRDPPRDSTLKGQLAEQALSGHFCERSLNPRSPPSLASPPSRAGPGSRVPSEALVSVRPLPASCAASSPTQCPYRAAPKPSSGLSRQRPSPE